MFVKIKEYCANSFYLLKKFDQLQGSSNIIGNASRAPFLLAYSTRLGREEQA